MLIESLVGAGVGGAITFFIMRNIDRAKYEIWTEQAKAKAKLIEQEANLILENAKNQLKEKELELQKRFDVELSNREREFEKKEFLLEQKEKELNELLHEQNLKEKSLQREYKNIEKEKLKITKQKELYNSKMKEAESLIERGAGLTKEEAKKILLEQTKQEIRGDVAHIIRKAVKEAERNAKREANWVIAQATTRFAGEFAGERLINVVHIPSDEIKGRIIGRDGKNIKSLESTLGVDIIVDDTPNAITVSHFNIYRRQVAVEVIKRLVEDGRIHPARI